MNIESPDNIESPEARKAYNLFRKEEKVRESTAAWTEYNRQKTGALQQLKRLREERLGRGPIASVFKPRTKRKSKDYTTEGSCSAGRITSRARPRVPARRTHRVTAGISLPRTQAAAPLAMDILDIYSNTP
jgi:hypothetical protein